jgi:hypothetical protein
MLNARLAAGAWVFALGGAATLTACSGVETRSIDAAVLSDAGGVDAGDARMDAALVDAAPPTSDAGDDASTREVGDGSTPPPTDAGIDPASTGPCVPYGIVPAYPVHDRLVVGVADSDPPTAASPHWPGLRARHLRTVREFDIASRPCGDPGQPTSRAHFEQWLAATAAAGAEPFVVFRNVSGQPAPSVTAYDAAIAAFRARYPSVLRLGAWNEPNSSAYMLHRDPARAVEFYRVAASHCAGDCVVAAGELMDWPSDTLFSSTGVTASASAASYAARYLHFMGATRPALWTLHAWHDVRDFQQNGEGCDGANGPGRAATTPPCGLRYFLRQLRVNGHGDATVWLTEQGPFYRSGRDSPYMSAAFRDAHIFTTIPHGAATAQVYVFGEASQDAALRFALTDLVGASPRVARVYLYDFQSQCRTPARCKLDDTGLVSPNLLGGDTATPGTPRASYATVASWAARY